MTTPSTEQFRVQAFDLFQQGQDATMKLVGALSDSWTALSRGDAATGSMASMMPGEPGEMIDRVYDTGVQILEMQRALAHGALNAVTPAVAAFTAPPTPGR